MVTFNGILDPFTRIKPGPFISRYQDWIIFTLLLFFFWAIVGIALKRRFEQSRYLRTLITVVALMLSIGTYYSIYRGWLHLSLQGFGMLGAFLVFILIFFVVFGLIKAYGVKTWNALPIGYSLFYISVWAVSPNIFDTIARTFPLLNGILLVLFITSIIKSIMAFFRHSKSPLSSARELAHAEIHPVNEPEIEKEIDFEGKERKYIKKKTIKLTKRELKSVDHIDHYLKEIESVLKESDALTNNQKNYIARSLIEIGKTKSDFQNGLALLSRHISRYREGDRNKSQELRQRFHNANDRRKKIEIQREWLFEKKKMDIYDFIKFHNEKIATFLTAFDGLIQKAVSFIKQNKPGKAASQVETSRTYLNAMKDILKKLKHHEFYLLKVSKKEEKELKKEKKGK
jgi:hypothetical protein